ncbi:hypothetical protein PGTUg99_007280 [Puccinia graminis f. sp. tritici]|uniref:Uncharacterized protein n=1 Tax=Puccinia graminis f. sp. tritici TaxID=56615 RepID=A0A5B0R046_PUCGR|nr:hypothetical protein PGTUg99_007280 [Puccinia graminis f. sp. tritici]
MPLFACFLVAAAIGAPQPTIDIPMTPLYRGKPKPDCPPGNMCATHCICHWP